MPDHRDGYRLVNRMFTVFEELPARQQAIFVRLMGGPVSTATGAADDPELSQEVDEARAHFLSKLNAMDKQ